MTARKANTHLVIDCTIDQVHAYDIVHKGGVEFLVENVVRRNMRRTLTVRNLSFPTVSVTHTWDMNHEVLVQVEHDCTCSGSGVHYGHGRVENGVFIGHKGVCYGCHGKGWQDRSDVIRNHTYWSKYARV